MNNSSSTPWLLGFKEMVCETGGKQERKLLFAPVDIDDPILVHELKDVGGVHEDAHGADCGDEEEEPQLGPVHDHGHVLPVLPDLK